MLGFVLLTLGAALLLMGASATLGRVQDREFATTPSETRTSANLDAPASTTLTADVAAAGIEVARSLDVPADLSPAVGLLPNGGATGFELPLGIGASVALVPNAATDEAAGGGAPVDVESVSNRLVTPAATSVALGAAAFTGAGLLAYFWTSVKTWAARSFILPLIPLYAKITRAEVFDNGVRERIFNAIKARPGISASDLSRAVGVSWGTTIYHLEVLEQNRMVSSLRKGRHRRYFENGGQLGASKDIVALLHNAVTAQVAQSVRATPGVTQKDLARAIGLTPQALHWHLQRLVGAGLVRKERDGRVVRHFSAA